MNNKHDKARKQSGGNKPQSFNTGLSDALSNLSVEPLSALPYCKKEAVLQPEPMPDSKTYQTHDRRTPKNRQINTPASNINTELAEAFDKMVRSTLNDQSPSEANPATKDFYIAEGKQSRYFPSRNRTEKMLSRNELYLWSQLPEWENTKNFVSVRRNKCEYAYPIHSWLSVMELCEAIYKDCDDHHLIRVESRKAIAGVIQSYCDRGGSLDFIDRSLIEKEVRKRLSEIYDPKIILLQKRLQYDNNTKAALEATFQQHSVQAAYEERIRAYRARNPQDAGEARKSVRNRLDAYIAAKAKRVGNRSRHNSPGAFTHKTDDARTVWIGLDYGTLNVKVAFRDGEDDDQSVILELNPSAEGIGKFMISPVTLVEDDRIVHRLSTESKSPSWKHALSFYYGDSFAADDNDIRSWLDNCSKQNSAFSKRSTEELVLFFSSLHIAFILAVVGRAIRTYYRERDITDNLAFRVFMCAPVAALDQQLSQSVFQDCLTIADEMHAVLDLTSGNISVQNAFDAYDQASCVGILLEPRLCRRSRVVPEVLAEISSFAQSRVAREGVYALVDIGAGTLDLNVFKVLGATKNEGVRTPVFAAACHPNGVNHLESLLVNVLDNDLALSDCHFEEQKINRQFPDSGALAMACGHAHNSEVCSRLENAHDSYCADVAKRTRLTWAEAWKKRGLGRKQWAQLTMFLCGGGAYIRDIQKRLEAGMPDEIISMISHSVLPCPNEEEFQRPPWFPEEDFHRVAVAYGLTFGSDFEPYIILPSQVLTVSTHRETYDVESCYISKDMV